LVNFCSYLAGDWRSTVRLYMAISIPWFLGLIVAVNILGVLVLSGVMHRTAPPKPIKGSVFLWVEGVLRDPATLWCTVVCLFLFLSLYGFFITTKFKLRTRVRSAISAEKFSEGSLPRILDSSLTGADLLTVLYRGEVRAEHEVDASGMQSG